MAATVCPPPPLIAIDVVVVIGMLEVSAVVIFIWLALFVVVLELLEPHPAATSATVASGRIR
jgi:hypothetical protein